MGNQLSFLVQISRPALPSKHMMKLNVNKTIIWQQRRHMSLLTFDFHCNSLFLALRMGETYENAAQIQSMIGERNGHLQQGELQPAVLSTYRESENNTEENRYSQVIKSPVNIEENRYSQVIKSPTELPPKNVDPVPKSHTQGEGTKVKLYFKGLGTPPGVVMIINTVSIEVAVYW